MASPSRRAPFSASSVQDLRRSLADRSGAGDDGDAGACDAGTLLGATLAISMPASFANPFMSPVLRARSAASRGPTVASSVGACSEVVVSARACNAARHPA